MSIGPTSLPERGYQFGPFLFDPLRRLLWKDGRVVATTSKTLDILQLLIEHRDRVVSKDEFLRELWADTVVEEGTLVRHLSSLRKAMGLAPGQHDYIVTVSGHGYRFVAKVTELEELPLGLPTVAEHAHAAEPMGPPAPETQTRNAYLPKLALATVVVLAIVGGFAAWQLSSSEGPTEPAAVEPPSDLRRVTFGPGSQFEPTWSNDGQRIAYTSDRAGTMDIWVQSVADATPQRITTSSANDWQPDWSPDGRWIAFRSERDGGGIYVVPSSGGAERRLAGFGHRPHWSKDSSRVLFSASMLTTAAAPRLFVVGLDGEPARSVRDDLTGEFRFGMQVAWHPDGERVSMWGNHQTKGWTFVTASINGTDSIVAERSADLSQRLRDLGVSLRRFVWDKSARYLYFEGRIAGVQNLWRVEVEAATTKWINGPERLTLGSGDDTGLAIAADGQLIAFASRKSTTRIWSFPLDPASGRVTGRGVALTQGGVNEQGPDAPFNGGKLLYRASLGRQNELREVSLSDGRDRLLLRGENGSTRTNSRWSPDGRRVAYDVTLTSNDGTSTAVAMLSTQDHVERFVTTPGSLRWNTFGWSPDGASILGSCRPSPEAPVAACLLPISDAPRAERAVRVIASAPDADLFQQQYSPDRKRLLFMAVPKLEGGASTIHVVPATGGAWTAITEGRWSDDKPRWAPDGRTIYFLSNRDGFLNIWARRFDAVAGRPVGESFRVTSFDTPRQMLSAETLNSIEIAVLADRLILPVTESSSEIWLLDRVK